ncbi:MAG: ATP-dependent helicase HepA [Motiliproteus sp.]|jgi:ATP-dependent helicase HepA
MAQVVFVLGQRWISHGESELGLGMVTEKVGRQVQLFFPAAEEYRTYATEDAPLSRYSLETGMLFKDIFELEYRVEAVEEDAGLFRYAVASDPGAAIDSETEGDTQVWIEERDLDPFVELNRPQDRFFAGQIDGHKAFELRRSARHHQHRLAQSDACGLLGPRVQLLPHQFYIASQVSRRHAPRVLLADEVGLGKTIEAGLIIHQQVISGRAERVLVVVPDTLIHQWLVEMRRRFNLHFSIMNREQYGALLESALPDIFANNPFDTSQLVICPQSLLLEEPGYHDLAAACHWDLLIVDEAHHLHWTEEEASPEYRCIEVLAAKARGLLLLTATPEQLGIEGHFARLRLIDPDRYYDLEQFMAEEEDYLPVRLLVEQLLETEDLGQLLADATFRTAFASYADTNDYNELIAKAQQFSSNDRSSEDALRNELVDQLLDHHGTGRVLFRNTREQVKGFPGRVLIPHLLEPSATLTEALAEGSLRDQLHPENLLGEHWLSLDPRVEWLQRWLLAESQDKVLLICADMSTAKQLEEHLRLRVGLRTAVFHEQLTLVNRDRAAAYFADSEYGAQVLVCSEIGSEGRNFQFAHQLVMFDLPLNPDLLEQRIGRLDRIGQTDRVEIHLPVCKGSPGHQLMRWLHEGLDAFLSPCPYGHQLLEQQRGELEALLLGQDEAAFAAFIIDTQREAEAMKLHQNQGRDRLLELNSCREEPARQILDALTAAEKEAELRKFLDVCFDHFGVDQQPDTEHSVILYPGDQMRCSFPGLPEDGLTGSFNRQQALEREDMAFLNWEHPLVQGAFDLITEDDVGNTAICTLKLPGIKPGTLLLECLFQLHCPAPRALQIPRYLPSGGYRLLLTAEAADCSALISAEQLTTLAQHLPYQQAKNLIKPLRDPVTKLLAVAEQKAEQQLPMLIEQAQTQMNALQQPQLERLQRLAQFNHSIRTAEIEQQQSLMAELQQSIGRSLLKLDAIQVLVTT